MLERLVFMRISFCVPIFVLFVACIGLVGCDDDDEGGDDTSHVDEYEQNASSYASTLCECVWEDEDFDSQAECLGDMLEGIVADNCGITALRNNASDVLQFVSCANSAVEAAQRCLDALSCSDGAEELLHCAGDMGSSIESCPELPDSAGNEHANCVED